jgi:hypothetical protein
MKPTPGSGVVLGTFQPGDFSTAWSQEQFLKSRKIAAAVFSTHTLIVADEATAVRAREILKGWRWGWNRQPGHDSIARPTK